MSNFVIFGPTQSGKTTLLGYLVSGMFRNPQFNDEILQKLKLVRKLTDQDVFSIGNPCNPQNINRDVILPSFVSLDRNELYKFKGIESSIGTTKRLHRKQLSICVSNSGNGTQFENTTIPCTFIDTPGFTQRIRDKYNGFYEGDYGIGVIKITDVLKLIDSENMSDIERKKATLRLFEPIKIWCSFRSKEKLVVVLSQIDRCIDRSLTAEEANQKQFECISRSIDFIKNNVAGNFKIVPISITLSMEENTKKRPRMQQFFKRHEENIYRHPEGKQLPGDGPLMQCLADELPSIRPCENIMFSMASVNRPMRAVVNNSKQTALNVRALHGNLQVGDSLFLGPVRCKSGEIQFCQCSVGSLKADGADEPDRCLLEGNVGGIIFKSLQFMDSKEKVKLSSEAKETNVKIMKSTILYKSRIVRGNILKMSFQKKDFITISGNISDEYSIILPSLMPYDEVAVLWFGKMITCNVIEIAHNEDTISLSVIIAKSEHASSNQFVLPCDENEKITYCDNVLLRVSSNQYDSHGSANVCTYINALINCITDSTKYNVLKIQTVPQMEIETLLYKEISFTMGKKSKDSVELFLNYSPDNQHSIHSLVSRIRKCLSQYMSRRVYLNIGGMSVQFVNE